VVTKPSGLQIGDIWAIDVVVNLATTSPSTIGAGWTLEVNAATNAGNTAHIERWWKEADATDVTSASVLVNFGASCSYAFDSYPVADVDTANPILTSGSGSVTTSAAAAVPSFNLNTDYPPLYVGAIGFSNAVALTVSDRTILGMASISSATRVSASVASLAFLPSIYPAGVATGSPTATISASAEHRGTGIVYRGKASSYPQIISQTTTHSGTDTTSHTLNVSAAPEGARLVMFVAVDLAQYTSNWPSGWERLGIANAGSGNAALEVWTKVAGASEASSFGVSLNQADQLSAWCYTITGDHQGDAPDISAATATLASLTHVIANVTPSWTPGHTLWLPALSYADGSRFATRGPLTWPPQYRAIISGLAAGASAGGSGAMVGLCVTRLEQYDTITGSNDFRVEGTTDGVTYMVALRQTKSRFPRVASVATFLGTGTDTTTHTGAGVIPANPRVGELLLMIAASDGNPTITGWDGTWTLIDSGNISGNGAKSQIWAKISDGTETTFDLTTSVAERIGTWTARIRNWHGTTMPEVGTSAVGSSLFPDPPSLSPSWGAEDTLWIALAHHGGGNIDARSYPKNYEGGVQIKGNNVAAGNAILVSRRELNAASEDPGTCALSASDPWRAQTIAIRPAPVPQAPSGLTTTVITE
jgi:hypothetical protein